MTSIPTTPIYLQPYGGNADVSNLLRYVPTTRIVPSTRTDVGFRLPTFPLSVPPGARTFTNERAFGSERFYAFANEETIFLAIGVQFGGDPGEPDLQFGFESYVIEIPLDKRSLDRDEEDLIQEFAYLGTLNDHPRAGSFKEIIGPLLYVAFKEVLANLDYFRQTSF